MMTYYSTEFIFYVLSIWTEHISQSYRYLVGVSNPPAASYYFWCNGTLG